jgi:hypothetical protein
MRGLARVKGCCNRYGVTGLTLDYRPTSNLPHPPVSSVPVEMCELSELCELSRQDAMESLSVKGAMGGGGSLF